MARQAAEAAPAQQQAATKPFYLSFLTAVNATTIQGLLAAISQQIAQGFDEMHLLLSTPGGSVQAGLAAYNVIRAMPLRVTTYNVGQVNSIGNVIYLAGDERYAAPTSSFMFHGVGFDVEKARFEERDLNDRLNGIKNDQNLIADVVSRHTNMDTPAVNELFLRAAFVSANDAKGRGIVDDVRDIQVPKGIPFLQLAFQG